MIETVSLAEFAKIVGVSEPTVRKRIADHADFPIETRGKNGEAYEIPVADATRWWRAQEAAEEEARRARADAINQMALAFVGDGAALGEAQTLGLTPAEQNALMEAELKAIKVARERGELVRAVEVEATAGAWMALVKAKYETLGDRLRKRVAIDRETLAALDRLVARDLEEMAAAALELGEARDEEGAAADSAV